MKKKIIFSIAFIISLLPMSMNQYGGLKGVQEITGMINLLNPIGIISVVLFFTGVWITLKQQIINKVLSVLGTVGIVLSEIYKFIYSKIKLTKFYKKSLKGKSLLKI